MNADANKVWHGPEQRPRGPAPQYPKNKEDTPAVPLGTRFNWGHQKTPSGRSLYPVYPKSVFHKSN